MKIKYTITAQDECFIIQNDLKKFKRQIQLLKPSQIVLVCDKKVQKSIKPIIKELNIKKSIFLKVEESVKSVKAWSQLQKIFYGWDVDRRTVVLAAGGGVVGDLVGFVCHTYMRGVQWISVPTTLLSQVDSGVGGKNAINTHYSKNIIGTVYQPRICYLSSDFLKTLPERELSSGLGEMLKYELLSTSISLNNNAILGGDFRDISKIVLKCIKYKLGLVSKDPQDLRGIRQKLNLGHTFAHALEKATNFKKYRHGEAVIYGLQFALIVSHNKGLLKKSLFERYMAMLKHISIPDLPRSLSGRGLYKLAQKDKKSISGEIKMVLLEKTGKIRNPVPVTKEEFLTAYEQLKLMD